MTLGKEEGERNNRKVGKWREKERKHKKGKNKNRKKKNGKGKRSYDFQGRKIEEEKIKRRQNEKQV